MEIKLKRRSEGQQKTYRRAAALGWLFSAMVVLLVLTLLFLVWLTPMRIVGDSMSPALRENEIVLVDRLAKYWKSPARGDMILFETSDGVFIKRIVALPGETVEMLDGRVFINSVPLDENAYASNYVGSLDPLVVPDGCVFVLGDNREEVYDSRMERVGCLAYDHIQGVLRFRVAPVTRLTLFL